MITSHTVLDHHSDCLVGSIVDNRQALETATRGDSVEDKIHRPNFIGSAWSHQGLALAERDLLAPPTPDLQLFQRVEPLDTLVVDDLAGLSQLQVNHRGSVASMPLRQRDDPLS